MTPAVAKIEACSPSRRDHSSGSSGRFWKGMGANDRVGLPACRPTHRRPPPFGSRWMGGLGPHQAKEEAGSSVRILITFRKICASPQRRGWILAAGMGLLAGCTVLGPEFKTPEAPLAERYSQAGDQTDTASAEVHRDWWRRFRDRSLEALIVDAHAGNLPLRLAALRILEARAQLGIATGRRYPQLQQLRGSLQHQMLSDHAPNLAPLADTDFHETDFGLDLSWEIDFWGRFRRLIESAEAEYLASLADYDASRLLLTADVASTYTTIRSLQEEIRITRENLRTQQRSLEIARTLFEEGSVSELDVQQAQTLLADTQARLPELQARLQQGFQALATLLGQPVSGIAERIATGAIPRPPRAIAVGIPAELLRRRPDVRRAELEAAAQSARVGVAETDLYPRVSLFGSLGLRAATTGTGRLEDLADSRSLEMVLGPQFTWNLFNYGRLENAVRVEDARLQQAIVRYQHRVLVAAQEVENGVTHLVKARERSGYLQQAVRAAQRAVELALLQYREGVIDFQRVLDSQRVLLGEQQSLVASRGALAEGAITLYKALGGGWDPDPSGARLPPRETLEEMRRRTHWGDLLPAADPSVSSVSAENRP